MRRLGEDRIRGHPVGTGRGTCDADDFSTHRWVSRPVVCAGLSTSKSHPRAFLGTATFAGAAGPYLHHD